MKEVDRSVDTPDDPMPGVGPGAAQGLFPARTPASGIPAAGLFPAARSPEEDERALLAFALAEGAEGAARPEAGRKLGSWAWC